jgi:hypothetical protein
MDTRCHTMKKKYLLIILIAVFLGMGIAAVLYSLLHSPAALLERRTVYVDVTVVDYSIVGFNANASALNFGRVPLGGYAKKWLMLENTYPFPVKVTALVSGNITPFLSSSNYTFSLEPGQVANISVSVSPFNATPAHYEGYLAYDFFKK